MAFNILAIDGGGTRGIFPARLLQKIQEDLHIDFTTSFDLIIGTSSGSIVGTAAAIEFPLSKVLDFFKNSPETILRPQKFSLNGLFRSKYYTEQLEKAVESAIGDMTFEAAKTRLIIPSSDIANADLCIFRSAYLPQYKDGQSIRLVDAIVSSCSAPLYFDPHYAEGRLLSDGGLWAQNPALLGVIEAISVLHQNTQDIRVLSIGTGIERVNYGTQQDKSTNWGLMKEWKGIQLANTFLHFQGRAAEYMVESLIPKENYLRLDFTHEGMFKIDDVTIIDWLFEKADQAFEEYLPSIKSFFTYVK